MRNEEIMFNYNSLDLLQGKLKNARKLRTFCQASAWKIGYTLCVNQQNQ